jgi:hypothetical protein
MWINWIFATGPTWPHDPTWTSPMSSAYCKSGSVVHSFFSWHYWSLLLWECGGAYRNCEHRAPHSPAGNIFVQWVNIFIHKICCCSNKMEQQLIQHKFPCKSSEQCFSADSFLILGTSPGLPAGLTLQYQTTTSGAVLETKSISVWNTSCQYLWPKTPNSGVYSGDSQGIATTCYSSLFIATAGLYWTMWWSPTKCHIQTVMTEMNSHGHGMHLIVVIKFFHFALKSYFI